ncbi:hypothetical protein K1719_026188 [Acacia pycnantha]|nr:hypothetical protein K1719_026188 [Acacia pycnantha]
MASSSAPVHSVKQKVFTCLTKLSDRNTQSIAANELESIAQNLDSSSVSVFLTRAFTPPIHQTNRRFDVRIDVPSAPTAIGAYQGYLEERDEMILERPILNKKLDERKCTFGGSKIGSRLVPCHEESQDSVAISNVAKDFHGNDKYCEELALIHSQLFQIQK